MDLSTESTSARPPGAIVAATDYVLAGEEADENTAEADHPLQGQCTIAPVSVSALAPQQMDRGIETNQDGDPPSPKCTKNTLFSERAPIYTNFSEMDEDEWMWFKSKSPTRPEAYLCCCCDCRTFPECYWDINTQVFFVECLCFPCHAAFDTSGCGACCEGGMCCESCIHCCCACLGCSAV